LFGLDIIDIGAGGGGTTPCWDVNPGGNGVDILLLQSRFYVFIRHPKSEALMSYGGDGQTKKIILHMELEKCIVGGDEECNSLHLGISSIEVSRIQSFPLADCDSRNVEMSG